VAGGVGRHPRGAGRRLARERGERGPWLGQSVASTARGSHRGAGRGTGKGRAPRRGGGRRLARERRCQRPSNDALAIDALAVSAATLSTEGA
jgi:hypothetical protein